MKTYSRVSDSVDRSIERMRDAHHEDLIGVTIGALFIFDLESTDPVLTHNGYAAAALIRIVPLRDRAAGMPDAQIIVDRSCWMTLGNASGEALIDHELTHLMRVLDSDTGAPLCDAVDRPKLEIRKHDQQMGWFDQVAARHGEASMEVRQARQLIQQTDQLYFNFALPVSNVVNFGRKAEAAAATA